MKKVALAATAIAVLALCPVAQAKPGSSKRCAKSPAVGFVATGSLAGYDETSVSLGVARANKHARRWLVSNEPVFTLLGVQPSFEGVTDANADGAIDLADVVASDTVQVMGKLTRPKRGCEGASSLRIRRVTVTRETDGEAGEEPTPAPQVSPLRFGGESAPDHGRKKPKKPKKH